MEPENYCFLFNELDFYWFWFDKPRQNPQKGAGNFLTPLKNTKDIVSSSWQELLQLNLIRRLVYLDW